MNELIKKQLGLKVKVLRENASLTQEELSEICDVSWRTISNLERGVVTPDLKVVLAISHHFGISLDDLLSVSICNNKSASRQEIELQVIEKIKMCDDKVLAYLLDQLTTLLKYFK